MTMIERFARARPLLFGPPQRQLFAMLHLPGDGPQSRAAVLLCPPFGQEAIRAHRTFKVLAERLARAGHPAIRFDYFGSGDSGGEDDEVSLAGMSNDIGAAGRQLRDVAAGRPVTWLGLGLGATAAWLCASVSPQPPDQLLIWDPVLDGQKYLQLLRDKQAQFIRESFSLRTHKVPAATDVLEAVGFAVAPKLQADLRGLSADKLPTLPASVRTILVSSPDSEDNGMLLSLARAAGAPIRHIEVKHDVDWLMENMESGPLVPSKALQVLEALARESA